MIISYCEANSKKKNEKTELKRKKKFEKRSNESILTETLKHPGKRLGKRVFL